MPILGLTAAVKIITAQDESDRPPYYPHLVVTARPHTHRLKLPGKSGLALGIHPHPRFSEGLQKLGSPK